jgi:hypothetical protein
LRISESRIILIGFFLRAIVAFWNGFFGPSPGADLDAMGMHGFASDVAKTGDFEGFNIGFTPYTNILGLIYRYTFDHIFVGSLLSCFIWWLSAHLVYKSFVLLSTEKKKIQTALWIYTLIPSSIFMTSVTVREPYQMLFVNFAIYFCLKIFLKRGFLNWPFLILSILAAGFLHGALLAFGIIFFAGTLLLVVFRKVRHIPWLKLLALIIVATVFVYFGFSAFINFSYDLSGGLANSVENYQINLLQEDARTHYKTDVSISSMGGLFIFIPIGFIQYLFEPFPWHITAISDVVVFLENIVRAWLIWTAWQRVRASANQFRRFLYFAFIFYLIIELIWSVGTINWGTSVRHHLPAWSLILIACFGSLSQPNKRSIKQNYNHGGDYH